MQTEGSGTRKFKTSLKGSATGRKKEHVRRQKGGPPAIDPKTPKVIEYPFPHFENCAREFFRDTQGRMWYGTSPNNKVGYFYLTGKDAGVESALQ